MVDFADANGTEIIRLLGAVLAELQKLNESVSTMKKDNAEKYNEVIKKIEDVEYSVDHIGPLEVYGDI